MSCQAEDGIRDYKVTGVQTCALPIYVRQGSGFLPRRRGRQELGAARVQLRLAGGDRRGRRAARRRSACRRQRLTACSESEASRDELRLPRGGERAATRLPEGGARIIAGKGAKARSTEVAIGARRRVPLAHARSSTPLTTATNGRHLWGAGVSAQEAGLVKKAEFAAVSYLPKTAVISQSRGSVASARNAC